MQGTEQGLAFGACVSTRLKDHGPLSVCDGWPPWIPRTCLFLCEVPDDLNRGRLAVQLCNDAVGREHMQPQGVDPLQSRHSLSASQGMKLHAAVARIA